MKKKVKSIIYENYSVSNINSNNSKKYSFKFSKYFNPKDLSLKVRSEQLKTLQMNAMVLFVIILVIITLYSLVYVNTDFDFSDYEINLISGISSLNVYNQDNVIENIDSNNYITEDTENGFNTT